MADTEVEGLFAYAYEFMNASNEGLWHAAEGVVERAAKGAVVTVHGLNLAGGAVGALGAVVIEGALHGKCAAENEVPVAGTAWLGAEIVGFGGSALEGALTGSEGGLWGAGIGAFIGGMGFFLLAKSAKDSGVFPDMCGGTWTPAPQIGLISDESTTQTSMDPSTHTQVATRVIIDPNTGDTRAVTDTVIGLGESKDPNAALFVGNTYVPGHIGVGQELNALDRISEENYARSLLSQSATTDNTAAYTRQGDIDAYVHEQQLAASRADASANGHHPDEGGGDDSWADRQASGTVGGGRAGSSVPTTGYSGAYTSHTGGSTSSNVPTTSFAGAYTSYTGGTTTTSHPRSNDFPIVLDLNGNGVEIATLDRSSNFVDSNGDGLQHRTAWAGTGDGVLFYDAGNDGLIKEKREYVFTEWDATAKDDMAALRSRFDSNNDGKLTAADADFAKFKVMVTNADGSQTAKTLGQLNITEINLKTDATLITFADGSQITGQTTFTMGGVTKTAAAVTLVSEADGHKLETTVDGATTTYVANDEAGLVLTMQRLRRRRGLTVRRRRDESVHARTLEKLIKSQESVNLCSSNLRGIVYCPIRAGRQAVAPEVRSDAR
jgi:hypothetical protein